MQATPEAASALRLALFDLGFDEVRFTRLEPPPPRGPLDAWLAAGMHGGMGWMERTADKRADPGLVLAGARSAIVLGVTTWRTNAPGVAADGGRWARYALHEDYHDTLEGALREVGRELERRFGCKPEDHRGYTDAGPVLERAWAARSGMGFVGKNAMMISRRHGNWLLLAAVLTRVVLPEDPPLLAGRGPWEAPGLLCGHCTRCLEACPTGAITAPGVVDARRCVSYLTIEHRGIVPRALREGIGDRLFGCDTCLEVCPWNRFARDGRGVLLRARDELAGLSLRRLLAMDQAEFSAVFRRTAIKRTKLVGLLRNACIVAGNRRDGACVPELERLAAHPDPVVRVHAVWALGRIGATEGLEKIRDGETSPEVLAEYAAAGLSPQTPGP
jgi:epoxyqueuosine reductase